MEKMWNVYLIHHHIRISLYRSARRKSCVIIMILSVRRLRFWMISTVEKRLAAMALYGSVENHWQIENFYQMADEELKKKFEAYVRSGEIGLSGNYLNMTELVKRSGVKRFSG